MKIKQLFDPGTSTYSYLIFHPATSEAAIIDPVKAQFERDSKYIESLGLSLRYCFDTHIHADHVTASGLLRKSFGAKTVMHKNSGVECANILTEEGATFYLGNELITVIETPGHTNTCMSLRIEGHVFTGDALLIRACGRTDFQSGNAGVLYESVTKKLFCLPDDTVVYPGHDYEGFTSTTIGEEKQLNPRLRIDISKETFIHIMESMDLPDPRRMSVAVPGNLACGL